MATPEEIAFIKEMQQARPRDVWQELWDLRQKLKGVETPPKVIYKKPPLDPEDAADLIDLFSFEDRARGYVRPAMVVGTYIAVEIEGWPWFDVSSEVT
jgi:hypothetical protein